MKTKTAKINGHTWHFIQTGGLMQLQITSIEDILNLKDLNQKLWIALACPVKGLEFSEETLSLIDTDKNGRVRVPEVLEAVEYIRTYFKNPEIIMQKGDSIPLSALGETNFSCGHSPLNSAKSILNILGKPDATELTLNDVSVNDKLFSPEVINGDGVLPSPAVKNDFAATVIEDIVSCTGGTDDISGTKGTNRAQFETFFNDLRAIKSWRESAQKDAPEIFFLKEKTDIAAASYLAIKDKVNEYFLRCSLDSYNSDVSAALRKKEEEEITASEVLSEECLAKLPIAHCDSGKTLPLGDAVNPAWTQKIADFTQNAVVPIFQECKTRLTESDWKKIESLFAPYTAWYSARPENSVSSLAIERIEEILSSDAENIIASKLDEEEKHPPLALATVDLRKMLLYRRDFVELVKNFVSFENFYSLNEEERAIFQCGTLYIDGRSCDLCFRVLDSAKHATMSPLSQCYLLYCDCVRPSEGKTMQIAALVSAGNRDNLIVGRNGLFYDRDGNDWDATITKIVENPISIREAFWLPYKRLARMIQERIAKTAAAAEANVTSKMANAVEKPTEAAAGAGAKKIDIGTVAAISVAFTGIAAVVGGILQAFLGLGYWIPLGIIGIILLISLPSMFIAWSKLRQRNIAPILDASGWAVNGNVKINIPLGALLTQVRKRPKNSKLNSYDPYAEKGFPIKRIIFCIILLALIIIALVLIAKNNWNVPDAINSVKNFFTNLFKTSSEAI